VGTFLAEACGRMVAPVPATLAVDAHYEARGIAYRIKNLAARRDAVLATVEGTACDKETGIQRKDTVTFDARTGLVCTSVALQIRETCSGDVQRFARERWQVRASAYVPAAAQPAK
jgi:hypothetical protein